jgi:HlyD family secretion protein
MSALPAREPRASQMTMRDEEIVQRFKSDADALEEARVPISAHATLYVLLVLLVLAVLWAIFGTLDRIVVAPGKVATRTPMQVMQPFTTSRVLKINVQPGDHVRKGQVLVNFDPSFARADVTALLHKVNTLSAQAARIEAELTGQIFQVAEGDPPERLAQAQIFQQEMSDFHAEMDQRVSRLNQIESQIGVDQRAAPGMRDQLAMAQNVAAIQRRLQQQAAAAHLDVMRAESAVIDARQRLANTEGDLTRLTGQRAEYEQERQAYVQKWRSDHGQQLVQTRQDLSDANETLNKALKMQALTELTAPADGTVLQVADRSEGSVLREAETLVTLVPDGARLYIEANVPSRDISYLRIGDEVRIKLEAFPFQRMGTLDGVLTVIGADSQPVNPESNRPEMAYRVQVRITDSVADMTRRGFRLRPGMVASAEIKTGKRSIMTYILDPVLRTTDEGMREP